MNFFKSIKILFDTTKSRISYHFFTKLLPFSILGFSLHYIYQYKLYDFKNHVFNITEEKNIGKKIYPLIKYKFIDRTYKTNSFEYQSISKLYGILLKQLKLNLKNEVIIVQSDLPFNFILPSGTMFMSDESFLYFIKDFDVIVFMISHLIFHIKNRHTCINIESIYSKPDLLYQFNNLMNQEAGFQHYFVNYYLYFPFSSEQEKETVKHSLQFMMKNNYIKKENIDDLLNKVLNTFNLLKEFSKIKVENINECLNNKDIKRKEIQKNPLFSNIMYGDFKYKNEEVEVFLHQRTSKKVKYKKREYAEIHPLEHDLLTQIKNEVEEEDIQEVNSLFEKEISSLKNSINKVLN